MSFLLGFTACFQKIQRIPTKAIGFDPSAAY